LNDSEYRAIRGFGLTNPVAVIPNGTCLPQGDAHRNSVGGREKILLFLGRIHPKKGLVELLRAWTLLKARHPGLAQEWRLIVAGWDDGGHLPALHALAAQLGLGEDVEFPGPLFGAEKDAVLARASAFALPSFSEGLPMAVLEAWAWRLPVFMTRQCNLPEGFQAGAAFELPTDPAEMAEVLAAGLEDPALELAGEAGRNLVEERYTWPAVTAEMIAVYDWLVRGGSPPACVRFD
jgi:poly(glycerol-phosphate) alpha-glucosyltransferase